MAYLPRLIVVIALVAPASRPAVAQSVTGIPSVDSAAVARGAWRRGQLALRARDYPKANEELAHAAAAWPTQPAYVWGRAVGAALVGDSATVRQALKDYADLGLGNDVATDTIIGKYTRLPSFRELAARLERNRAPLARSHVVTTLPDSTQWPEGMDFDARSRTWFVSSVRHRTIVAMKQGEAPRELWPAQTPNMGAVLAVRVDTVRGVLWATMSGIPQMGGYVAADSQIAALVEVRISDGGIIKRWNLPAVTGGHVLGDVALGANGDVWFSDSNEPVLYRLKASTDTLQRITSPFFRSLQGIAPAADGRIVYVADYSHGFMRVDTQTGDITRVGDAPSSTSLGCDGIVWYRGSIIAIQNGVSPARVVRFRLDASGTHFTRAEAIDRNSSVADEPTIGTMVRDEFVYVANSQWEKFGEDGVRKPGVRLTSPILLGVRVGK